MLSRSSFYRNAIRFFSTLNSFQPNILYSQNFDLKPENFVNEYDMNSYHEYINYLDQEGKKHYLAIENFLDDDDKKLYSALKHESIEIPKWFVVGIDDGGFGGSLQPQVIIKNGRLFRNSTLIFSINTNNKLNHETFDLEQYKC